MPSPTPNMGSADATLHGPTIPAPLAPDLRVGTRLAGYEIEELIGYGGMGVVYRAQHVHLGRTVALKLLGPDSAQDAGFRERFVRESRIAASLQHPSIVTVYDAGEADGLLYIAMQYVEGTDLGAVLADEGALPPERALGILDQIAAALDAAHATGIVHRDVKPGNVLLASQTAYLTDFGLTRRLSSQTGLTRRGQFVGTADYMPPEQISGGALDPRTDVYALGAVLFHALAGSVPYERDSEVSVIYAHMQEPPPSLLARQPRLPSGLDTVIAKAMAKQKEDRYASCGDLIADAREVLGDALPPAGPPREQSAPRRKVLIADDDAGVRAVLRVTLDAGRFELLEAHDAQTAVALARNERPELVFVDWDLPRLSIAQIRAAVESGGDRDGVTIVAVTARADEVDEQAVRAAGADDQLRRPFSPMQLLHKLRELTGPEGLA